MRYRIGDVSRILGISTDLLRYYEKKGVVKPEKDKANGYRYYDTWDINLLIDCIWYKNLGFSIDHIADMGSSYSFDQLSSVLDKKHSGIEETIARQRLILERLEEYLKTLSHIKDNIGLCSLCDSPEIIYYFNRHSATYVDSAEQRQISGEWLKYMPFLKRCFEFPLDSLLGGGSEFVWGFSLDACYAEQFSVTVKKPVMRRAPVLSLHSAFKSAGKNAFTPRHLDYMLEYIRANSLEPAGNAFGNLVCSVIENGVPTGYFEVWLPVATTE